MPQLSTEDDTTRRRQLRGLAWGRPPAAVVKPNTFSVSAVVAEMPSRRIRRRHLEN